MNQIPLFKEDFAHMSITDIQREMLNQSLRLSRNTRSCSRHSDLEMLEMGVCRTLSKAVSGRDFLQQYDEVNNKAISRDHYFDALRSKRRAAMCTDVAEEWFRICKSVLDWADVDYLANFTELDALKVLAVDGHQVAHACHDPKRGKGEKARYTSANELYSLDLRSGLISASAPVAWSGSKNHEIPAFRQLLNSHPHLSVPEIHVGDRAYLDNNFWGKQAQSETPRYLVTRTKVDMRPIISGLIPFDRNDPVNIGVSRVRTVGFNNCIGTWYIVDFTDPETQESFEFLTTFPLASPKNRPGTIAYLYKLRWRIEKVFDNFKNDFLEKKAWATGQHALVIQSTFSAMTYNLLRMTEALLKLRGVTDEKVKDKYKKALEKRKAAATQKGGFLHPLEELMPRMARLSSQFIRTFRNLFHSTRTLIQLLHRFRATMMSYR